ncbi:MAG: hypothetical protein WDM90_00900 [Ferruginibacter sp.]
MIPKEAAQRLNNIIELSWEILFERIISGNLKINKEFFFTIALFESNI